MRTALYVWVSKKGRYVPMGLEGVWQAETITVATIQAGFQITPLTIQVLKNTHQVASAATQEVEIVSIRKVLIS